MPKKTPSNTVETNSILHKKWIYILAPIIVLAIAAVFYYPSLLGKSLPAHDFQQGSASSYQLHEYFVEHGEYANWAPNMFSGMPSFQLYKSYHNISSWISDTLYDLTNPYIFISILIVISSALLFYVMGVHPLLVVFGGIGLLLSNFTVISVMAGHNNKVMVISIVPLTLAGIWLLFEKKKYLLALPIIALSISLQVRLLHVQITYFMAFLVGFWTLFNVYYWIKNKEIKHLALSILILFLGIGLGAINNSTQLISTKDYTAETQRGGPSEVEISKNPNQKESDGLAYDYATAWSYGILESFTTLIPNFSGGPDPSRVVNESSQVVKVLTQNNVPAHNAIQVASQLPTYWGSQPFVAGTTYIGAILMYLMFLGVCILPDRKKWWLLASFIITFFVAWGDNFSTFYHLLFDYLPYFNKFRTPSMIFYLTTIITVMMSVLTIQYILDNAQEREKIWDKFLKSTLVFLGFVLFLALIGPSIFSFSSETLDGQLRAQLLQMTQNNSGLAQSILDALIQDRKSMMRADAFRSFLWILLTAGAIAIYLKRKISKEIMLVLVVVFLLIDVVGVDRRYVKHDSFQENEVLGLSDPIPTNADRYILEDKSNYRVLDLTVNTFNDAKPSYFHQNIGGYHSVKLKRYQDIISFQIQNNLQQISQGNGSAANVLNMLNAKYIITGTEAQGVYKNEYAYGNAWMVHQVKVLEGPVQVFDQLMQEDLKTTALLEQPNSHFKASTTLSSDSSATIELIEKTNDALTYQFSSTSPEYVVFSEIYYNHGKGWNAYIDGNLVEHDQVNYILRGLFVPAGQHEIVFKFDNPKYQLTRKIDFASSFVIILLIIGGIALNIIQRKKGNAETSI